MNRIANPGKLLFGNYKNPERQSWPLKRLEADTAYEVYQRTGLDSYPYTTASQNHSDGRMEDGFILFLVKEVDPALEHFFLNEKNKTSLNFQKVPIWDESEIEEDSKEYSSLIC